MARAVVGCRPGSLGGQLPCPALLLPGGFSAIPSAMEACRRVAGAMCALHWMEISASNTSLEGLIRADSKVAFSPCSFQLVPHVRILPRLSCCLFHVMHDHCRPTALGFVSSAPFVQSSCKAENRMPKHEART